MQIHAHFSYSHFDELTLSGKSVVVIDVLRATSTMITALKNGARSILPVDTVEFARKAPSQLFGGQLVLGGERNTKRIDGFNYGNSPLEYTHEEIHGKAIVLFTTNGTRAIMRAKYADELYICAFLNVSAVAETVYKPGKQLHIICAGRNNEFGLEDAVCAGVLIRKLQERGGEFHLNDAATTSVLLAHQFENNIPELMKVCDHGKVLEENGFAADLEYCGRTDSIPLVPFMQAGEIKLPPQHEV